MDDGQSSYFSLFGDAKPTGGFKKLLAPAVRGRAVSRPVDAYVANMERLSALAALPANLIGWESHQAYLWCYACHEVVGEPRLTARNAHRREEVTTLFMHMLGDPDTYDPSYDQRVDRSLARWGLEELAGPALRALLASLLIGAWSAYETLAADLWVDAVNRGPKSIAKRLFRAQRSAGGLKPDGGAAKSSSERTIPLSCLAEYGYDLRRRMGDLLRDRKKVDFQSLRNIQKAYVAAFGESADAAFTGECRDIWALSAFRNCLLHASGKVDSTFRTEAKAFPEFAKLERGSPLPIDPATVSRLWNESVRSAVSLIATVDR